MILCYDTETTGLVDQRQPEDHPTQPYLVQLGAVLLTDSWAEVSVVELVVRPEGWTIPERAARVHGITTEIAMEIGVPMRTVLSVFYNLRARARELVAFNMDFDDLVMRANAARFKAVPSHPGPELKTCCMREATPIMALPPTAKMKAAGFDHHKPPNLMEAHTHFMGTGFHGAHSALADARAAVSILRKMREVV